MKRAILLVAALVIAATAHADTGAAPAAEPRPYPPLGIEGGFDNAQLHATSVEDPTGEAPTVVIGGTVKQLEHQAVPTRHQHKYYHYHLKLVKVAGRRVRFRYGPFPGKDPHVSVLKTPVVYYEDGPGRYELVKDVRAEVVFLGERDEDRADGRYWGVVVEFTHRFRGDSAYLCQSFPFTNDDLARLANEVERRPHAEAVELGRSKHDKLALRQIVVTDPDVGVAAKKGVWLHAGEDPWEFPGMIACAGAARWAMGDDPVAREFRRRFVLYAMPIAHPDAVRRGWTNYSVDGAYTQFVNYGWSYDRTDVPEHDLTVARIRAMKEKGLPIDYAESMHSSISWSSFIRFHSHDEAASREFVTKLIDSKYIPWNTWTSWSASAKSRERFAPVNERGLLLRMKEFYPNVQYHASHTEQIIFPLTKLPGFDVPPFPAWGRTEWTDDDSRAMRGQMIPHRWEDIEDWGRYRLMALMEYHGCKLDPKDVAPQLICGDVDACASRPGDERTFTVLYRDVLGREPANVTLHLADGTSHKMTRDAGTSPLHAIRFKTTVAVRPDKGHDFHFTAAGGASRVRYPREGCFLGPYVYPDE